MFLRYSFIYFYNEQNWNKKISLNEHNAINDLFARWFEFNQVEHYDMIFENRDKLKIENAFNFNNSNTAQNNKNNKNNAVCDKREFTQITQKGFYWY